jgi:hypothetical protein
MVLKVELVSIADVKAALTQGARQRTPAKPVPEARKMAKLKNGTKKGGKK